MHATFFRRIALLAALGLAGACSPEVTAPDSGASGLAQANGGRANTWQLLAPAGAGPAMITASAHAPRLRAIFAASMPDYTASTLWRFDLSNSTWHQLPATNWPIGKYRNLIYDPGQHRLLTYWDGLGQVWAIPDTGGAWAPEGSAPNLDSYYEGYAFLNPVSRRLTVFAGYGLGSWSDLLWDWDAAANAWQSVPQSSPRPEPRFGHGPSTVAVDVQGKRAFLGQRSLGLAPGNYDDLWQLDLGTGTWHNLIPASTQAWARIGSAFAFVATGHALYRFGGCSPLTGQAICSTDSNDLAVALPDAGTVHWRRAPVTGTLPAPRILAGLYFDAPGHRLILVSGLAGSASGNGVWQDDVWAYKLP